MARITAYAIFKYRYDLGGYKLSYGPQYDVYPIILKLIDSDGRVGWGEANPWQPFTREGPDQVFRALKDNLLPLVLAQDTVDPWRINDALIEGGPDSDLMAKGAINMALMDMEGKRRCVSVAELLGPIRRRTIPVSRPLNNGTAEDSIPIIDEAIREGYRHFMLKAGDKDHPALGEITRLAELQKRFGDQAVFKIDANTGWAMDQATAFLQQLPESVAGYLAYLEEPVAKGDVESLATLQAMTSVPISVDESLTSFRSAEDIIDRKAARVFSIKISKNGGLLNAQAIARLGAKHGIMVYPNSMAEGGITQVASLHLAVTLDNLVDAGGSFRSVLRLGGRDVTNFHEFIKRGSSGMVEAHLPDGPGFGVDVDEETLIVEAVGIYHYPS